MIFHSQLIKHDPDNGQWGDCFRTCIACIFNVHNVTDVPHFGTMGHTQKNNAIR